MDTSSFNDLFSSDAGIIVGVIGIFIVLAFFKKLIKLAIFLGIVAVGYYMFMAK